MFNFTGNIESLPGTNSINIMDVLKNYCTDINHMVGSIFLLVLFFLLVDYLVLPYIYKMSRFQVFNQLDFILPYKEMIRDTLLINQIIIVVLGIIVYMVTSDYQIGLFNWIFLSLEVLIILVFIINRFQNRKKG